MPLHTKYNSLSDEEFLRQIDENRAYSPVISELATRLEKANNRISVQEDSEFQSECPVCESKLNIEYNKDQASFSLETIEP